LVHVKRHPQVSDFVEITHYDQFKCHLNIFIAIQQSLLKLSENDVLANDSFVYIHRSYSCINNIFSPNCFSTPQRFNNTLNQLHANKTNVILSSEKLSRTLLIERNLLIVKQYFKNWNVRFVGVYRRYFDWLLSEYDQEGLRDQGYNENIRTLSNFSKTLQKNKLHAPLDATLVQSIKKHFEDFYIFSLYGYEDQNNNIISTSASTNDTKDHVMTRFICEAIPEAKHTCAKLKFGNFSFPTSNTRSTHEGTMEALVITVTLRKKKLLQFKENDKWKYFSIANKIDDYLLRRYGNNETIKPLQCISTDALNAIYNKSLTIEKYLLPKFHESIYGASMLKSVFDTFIEENKFCQLDFNIFFKKEQNNLMRVLQD